jgi:hypothetical protein
MTLADPARVEFDPVTAALVFEEVAQARDWWLRRLKLLRAIRLNLGDETEEEAELVLKVERLTEAARRIRVAMYGPDHSPTRLRVASAARVAPITELERRAIDGDR